MFSPKRKVSGFSHTQNTSFKFIRLPKKLETFEEVCSAVNKEQKVWVLITNVWGNDTVSCIFRKGKFDYWKWMCGSESESLLN